MPLKVPLEVLHVGLTWYIPSTTHPIGKNIYLFTDWFLIINIMVSKKWSDISSSTMCYPFVAFGNTSWHDCNICHRSPWQRMQPVLTKLLVTVLESNLHLSLISSTFTCLGFWKLMTTLMTCLTEDYVVTFHSVCFCILAKFKNTAEMLRGINRNMSYTWRFRASTQQADTPLALFYYATCCQID